MQERQQFRAAPHSEPKRKDYAFLPKIQRTDHASNGKSIFKNIAKQYNNKQIFVMRSKKQETQQPDEKVSKNMHDNPQKLAMKSYKNQIDQQKVKQSRQYLELEREIENSQKIFAQQMREIQAKQKDIEKKCNMLKQQNFKQKYNFWELKNQIIALESVLCEEQEQNYRIASQSYYNQDQYYSGDQEEDNDHQQQISDNLLETQSNGDIISIENQNNW